MPDVMTENPTPHRPLNPASDQAADHAANHAADHAAVDTAIEAAQRDTHPESAVTEVLVADELVEEVSIDGMCGVY